MTGLGQDLRYALRALMSKPGFALVAILTLALGIGANTATFSVLNAVVLRPIPYEDPDRLVLVWSTDETENQFRGQVSFTNMADLAQQNEVLENIGTFATWRPILSGDAEPERIGAAMVSAGFFDVMRAQPLLGRLFLPDDQEDGNDLVVVISDGLWNRRFGGDPKVIGREIRLNLVPYMVVGVLPPGFTSLPQRILAQPAELYRPLAETHDEDMRSARHLRAVARLQEGTELEEAQAAIGLIADRLAEEYPEDNAGTGFRLVPLKEDMTGDLRPTLLLLLGAVALVLLIACANVGNLLLARGAGRRRELGVRAALGASRARLIRQLLTESLVLALVGGSVGILAAFWCVDILEVVGSRVHPSLQGLVVDPTVMGFALLLSLGSVLIFGLAPAFRASSLSLMQTLKRGGTPGATVRGRDRLRDTLVIGEMALAVMLLIGAGLLIRTVGEIRQVDPGFDPAGKLTMDVWLPWKTYHDDNRKLAFFRQALERIEALPQVRSAGVASVIPSASNFDRVGIEVEGRTYPAGRNPSPDRYVVSPGYLRTMPITLLQGRHFQDRDREGALPVVLASETMASTLWPDEDPVGRRIRLPAEGGVEDAWRTIVGVVGDVRQYGLDGPRTMQLYLPLAQYPWGYMSLVVRAEGDLAAAGKDVRAAILAVDPNLPVFNVWTLNDLLASSIALRRLTMLLLATFAAIALALAAVGVYGVVSYSVSQRTGEIGIRMALGAHRRDVIRLVLRQGSWLTFTGLATGLIGAAIGSRLLQAMLFGVGPTDLLTFGGVALLLTAASLAACTIPTVRATRIDPMVALREE